MFISLFGKKSVSVFLAVALSIAGIGFASVTFSDQACAAGSKKKVSVYVLSKISNGDNVIALSYNKNGLISKTTQYGKTTDKITYKGVKASSHKYEGSQNSFNVKYNYKNGKLVKSSDSKNKGVGAFSSSKSGLLTKATLKYPDYSRSYVYDKKGRLKTSMYKDSSWELKLAYLYDSKGYPKKMTFNECRVNSKSRYVHIYNYKNVYKNGRLLKSTTMASGDTWGYTFKYKKIKVSSSYAKLIKKQQQNFIRFKCFDMNQNIASVRNGYL